MDRRMNELYTDLIDERVGGNHTSGKQRPQGRTSPLVQEKTVAKKTVGE